jgi:hypothetical protein
MSQKLIDRINSLVGSSPKFTPITEIADVSGALPKKKGSAIGGKLSGKEADPDDVVEATIRSMRGLKEGEEKMGNYHPHYGADDGDFDHTPYADNSDPMATRHNRQGVDIDSVVTPENAQEWSATHEKFLFCVDLLGISANAENADQAVNALEARFEDILSNSSGGIGESYLDDRDEGFDDPANGKWQGFDDYQWDCPACGGEVNSMGSLGPEEHGRCRDCGVGVSRSDMNESDSHAPKGSLTWRINQVLQRQS